MKNKLTGRSIQKYYDGVLAGLLTMDEFFVLSMILPTKNLYTRITKDIKENLYLKLTNDIKRLMIGTFYAQSQEKTLLPWLLMTVGTERMEHHLYKCTGKVTPKMMMFQSGNAVNAKAKNKEYPLDGIRFEDESNGLSLKKAGSILEFAF